jgi:beta-lactamase class A
MVNRRQWLGAAISLNVLSGPLCRTIVAADSPAYVPELEKIAAAHKGKVAIAVKNLKTGESWSMNADTPMPTASLIKFPVMIEAYRQVQEKKTTLDRMITLKKEDMVPGSGILTYDFTPGSTLALKDAVRLMIKFSDNTATNLVLDVIGLDATAKTMEAMGYPNTKIHSKVYKRETSVFPERSKQFGLGSTTAGEMIRLCESLQTGKIVSPEASKEMYAHLRTCDDTQKFPRYLPHGTKIAFKTGSVNASRTAAGIIETKSGPIALCVLTDQNEDQSWTPDNAGDVLCAKVAKVFFDHYNK